MANSLWRRKQSTIGAVKLDNYNFFHSRDDSDKSNYERKNSGHVGGEWNTYGWWIELMLRKDKDIENTNLQDQTSYLEDLKESE
jgi:hypothetical protein